MKDRFMYYFSLVAVLSVLFFTSACQKEDLKEPNQDKNNNAKDLARLLASAAGNNKDLRAFMKTEAVTQFDGDYNFLLAESLNKTISDQNLKSGKSVTFREAIKSNDGRLKSTKNTVDTELLLNSIIEDNPLLQISIPEIYEESTENWEIEEDNILVAYIDDKFDEEHTKTITAFDKHGNEHEVDAQTPPDTPLVIIRENERVIAIPAENDTIYQLKSGRRSLRPLYRSDKYNYYFKWDYYDIIFCSSTDTKNDNNTYISKYDRDKNNGRDVLLKARFVSRNQLRSVESWIAGKPEMKVYIVFAKEVNGNTTLGTTTKYIGNSGWYSKSWFAGKISLKTKEIDIPIISWDKDIYGDAIKYIWYEEDGGNDKEVTVNLTYKNDLDDNVTISSNTKITVNKRDDKAGDAIVSYTEKTTGEGTEYNTGIIKFWINQEED